MSDHALAGVIAAVPTPIDAGGAPDAARFIRHAAWALEQGADALNVLGTTGEATSFSAEQRIGLMRAAAAALPRARMMVGTGAADLASAVALTRAAHDLGFAAALVTPPFYYKGVSEDGVFDWFARLIAATEAAPIAIYLYNFPQMTGLPFSPALARRLKAAHPERVQGAKDSSGDLAYAAEIARIDGLRVFPSDEASLARAAADGFAGCISATVSVTARLAAQLWRDPSSGAALEAARAARAAIAAEPLIPAVKQLTALIHGDAGFAPPLPPHRPLPEAARARLRALAERLDLVATPAR